MAEPKPFNIALWIEETLVSPIPISLVDAIMLTLEIKIPGWSSEIIAEKSEALEELVFYSLHELSDLRDDEGIETPYEIIGVIGEAYIKSEAFPTNQILKNLRGILPTEFEQFCTDILTSLGGKSVRSGGTYDGGVDFSSEDLPISEYNFPALKGVAPLVIGQAKRYAEDKLVTVKEVREFLGAGLVRYNKVKRQRADRFGAFSPVVYAFWTTSNLNKNAIEFAKEAGIWHLGGVALAQLAFNLELPISQVKI